MQLSNQRQIIVAGFGFTVGQTTLLGTVDGAVESASLLSFFLPLFSVLPFLRLPPMEHGAHVYVY